MEGPGAWEQGRGPWASIGALFRPVRPREGVPPSWNPEGVYRGSFYIFVGLSRVQDRCLPGGPQGRERSRCRALGNPLQGPLGPLERGRWLVVCSQRCSFSRPCPLSAEGTRCNGGKKWPRVKVRICGVIPLTRAFQPSIFFRHRPPGRSLAPASTLEGSLRVPCAYPTSPPPLHTHTHTLVKSNRSDGTKLSRNGRKRHHWSLPNCLKTRWWLLPQLFGEMGHETR